MMNRGTEKEVSSEKEMCAVRKKAAPLEPLANFSGDLRAFPEAHAAPLGPLAEKARVFDDCDRKKRAMVCAPGTRAEEVVRCQTSKGSRMPATPSVHYSAIRSQSRSPMVGLRKPVWLKSRVVI